MTRFSQVDHRCKMHGEKLAISALPRCKNLTTDVTAEGDILHVLRHKSCSSSSFSGSRGSLVLVVLVVLAISPRSTTLRLSAENIPVFIDSETIP